MCCPGHLCGFVTLVAELEAGEHPSELFSLTGEFFGGSGAFLCAGGVCLGNPVDLAKSLINLTDAMGLFVAGRSDFADQAVCLDNSVDDFLQGQFGFGRNLRTVFNFAYRAFD